MKLRRAANIFYYSVFRFERYTQYLISMPMHALVKSVGLGDLMAKRSGKENWDQYILDVLNDPRRGISVISTGNHLAMLMVLSALTLLNLICAFLHFGLETVWVYGAVLAGISGVAGSYYVAPADTRKYLADFKKFESMSEVTKRRQSLVTFLIIIGIWSAFIGSFIYYIRTLISS